MLRKTFVFLIALSLSPISHGIGRTGNRSAPQGYYVLGDLADGFTSLAPIEYSYQEPMGNGNVRLRAPLLSLKGPGTTASIEVELLRASIAYPQFQGLSRQDIVAKLIADGWTRQATSDPCLEIFTSDQPNTILALALWGDTKGVLFRSMNIPNNKKARSALVSGIVLDPGACAWKINN